MLHEVLPPAVTGAVVMLIGFNLAPVVAGIYWPQDQWVALLTVAFMIVAAVVLPRLLGRIAVFLALIFGYAAVVAARQVLGPITSVLGGATEATDAPGGSLRASASADAGSASRATIVGADGVSVAARTQLLAHLRSCSCCPASSR